MPINGVRELPEGVPPLGSLLSTNPDNFYTADERRLPVIYVFYVAFRAGVRADADMRRRVVLRDSSITPIESVMHSEPVALPGAGGGLSWRGWRAVR